MFWSGVEGIVVSGPIAAALNLTQSTGFLVQKVADGSLSDKIGLQAGKLPVSIGGRSLLLGGDIIVSVEGLPFSAENLPEIRRQMSSMRTHAPLKLEVMRKGRLVVLQTRLPD